MLGLLNGLMLGHYWYYTQYIDSCPTRPQRDSVEDVNPVWDYARCAYVVGWRHSGVTKAIEDLTGAPIYTAIVSAAITTTTATIGIGYKLCGPSQHYVMDTGRQRLRQAQQSVSKFADAIVTPVKKARYCFSPSNRGHVIDRRLNFDNDY